jgi:hypothetical protein
MSSDAPRSSREEIAASAHQHPTSSWSRYVRSRRGAREHLIHRHAVIAIRLGAAGGAARGA